VLGVIFALLCVAAIIAMGGTGMATGGREIRGRLQARRELRWRSAVRIAELTDGCCAKVEGAAVALDGELEAPFSHRRCVAYELTVFDMDGVRPALLTRLVVTRPFLLRDGSGVAAHVVPEPAQVGILPDKQWRMEPSRLVDDPRVVALLTSRVVDARWRSRTLLVCEGVLAIGQVVAVWGYATREPDPEAVVGYRGMATRPCLIGRPDAPLLLASADG
jgi:hypothetical protein